MFLHLSYAAWSMIDLLLSMIAFGLKLHALVAVPNNSRKLCVVCVSLKSRKLQTGTQVLLDNYR